MKFLIVDDSKLSRSKILSYIEDLGHEVIGEAVDGNDAIVKAKELNPEYITMDLEMPNLSGVDATKKILSNNPNIKIILITSISDKTEIIRAIKYGAKGSLRKPITKIMLENELKKINR